MLIRRLLLEGRRESEKMGRTFQNRKYGPRIQVTQQPKEKTEAAFGPLQNTLFVEFTTYVGSAVLNLTSRNI